MPSAALIDVLEWPTPNVSYSLSLRVGNGREAVLELDRAQLRRDDRSAPCADTPGGPRPTPAGRAACRRHSAARRSARRCRAPRRNGRPSDSTVSIRYWRSSAATCPAPRRELAQIGRRADRGQQRIDVAEFMTARVYRNGAIAWRGAAVTNDGRLRRESGRFGDASLQYFRRTSQSEIDASGAASRAADRERCERARVQFMHALTRRFDAGDGRISRLVSAR